MIRRFYPSAKKQNVRRAQTAIEYMLLLGVTTVIALVGFRTMLPKERIDAERYYNTVVIGIIGEPPNANQYFLSYP